MSLQPTTLEDIVPIVDDVDLEAIARQELPRVERLLRRMLGPRSDMEDLVQAVFAELCRALPRFRGDAPLPTFIAAIAVRVARRAMRRPAWFRRRGPMPDQPRSHDADPEQQNIERRLLQRVRRALEAIRPNKRIAFALWAFEGMTVEAIATSMDATPAATKARIHAAQRELRAWAARDPELRELLGGER